ncbi:hypothetical Protein YC6258_05660 [Gynuella sunshinyii YC6258]|uniref:Uncharacterized protein n=1 Tax=Gynuella sunshinyii YC6258 TaxID=1445510 RepID=A0A0C5VWL0_9GAMM|nr:hypothetical Protein YC6258_05660 [Gynuella sunshinyii YC6258]
MLLLFVNFHFNRASIPLPDVSDSFSMNPKKRMILVCLKKVPSDNSFYKEQNQKQKTASK